MAVMSLVERGGNARSVHVDSITRHVVEKIIRAAVEDLVNAALPRAEYRKHRRAPNSVEGQPVESGYGAE